MKNPVLVELLDYWERLRDGRSAPLRSEIDPRQIENALEHAFILERTQNDQVRFRIAGMRLSDLMGMEVRGMPADSMIAPEGRETFDEILQKVFDGPEIVELHLEPARPGIACLGGQMLLLPMKSDRGEISRILGCIVADELTGAPPHRFVVAAKKATRIVTRGFEHMSKTETGFAEQTDSYTAGPVTPKRYAPERPKAGFLKLVKSDD